MKSDEIRSRFLKFFSERGHRVVRSSSLVPANDPTLLFSNAGMNQFKDVFLGREKRDYSRACSSQKCVRAGGKHNDLEQVGRTTRHHTFFEMLGNFSFGDYFKKEAIPWAWELITKDFAIPREKLYVTVFREDDEAAGIWVKDVGVEGARIHRCDEKDNFWQMGDTGPCGPCSEIHYDMGPAASDLGHTDCKFPCDCGRYVELWNLVFMQFNRDEQGAMTPLPKPSIDTGAGLERLAAVLQGKLSNFDTDLFRPLIDEAAELANVEYGANHETDMSLRIIADHSRAATFLISDGVLPSNEGRGYVLRRILRRALYQGQTLGLKEPFLYKVSGEVVELMKGAYPELVESAQHVAKAIKNEEKQFARALAYGLQRLEDDVMSQFMNTPGVVAPAQGKYWNLSMIRDQSLPMIYDGTHAFRLYDTYGLPVDFITEFCRNLGIGFDQAGFDRALGEQRERARASWKVGPKKSALPLYQKLAEKIKTEFRGYDNTTWPSSRVVALIDRGLSVGSISPTPIMRDVEVILDETPFYAEAGGQVGDTGRLVEIGTLNEIARVTDTFSPVSGLVVHKAIVRQPIHLGGFVTAAVDTERRDAIRRNHTATHLLHAALRNTLGTHVKQAGSLVAPDRLRFDFSHYTSLDEQDLLDIEDLVVAHILKNEEVRTEVMELDAAVNSGAMALFGEKYGDKVRVVSIEDGSFSKELCGGTHARRTGDIGMFKIVGETSVAAGTRRIEAVTGTGVLEALRRESQTLRQLGDALRAKPDELLVAVEKLEESEKKLRKQLEAQQMKRAASAAGDLVAGAQDVKGVRVVAARVDVTDRAAMRQMVDNLRARLGTGVIALGSASDGKVALVVAVTQDLTNRLDAGKIVKQAAALVEGSGGGRKDLAEAGGKNPERLDESIRAVPSIVEKML